MVQKEERISRRALLGGGALGATGLVAHAARARAQSTQWSSYESESGASIRYPGSWTLQPTLVRHLVDPLQSFSVASGPAIDQFVEELPDLSAYPRDAVLIWMLHYDSVIEGRPFASGVASRRRLVAVSPQFAGFSAFTAGYSGSDRSFLLRLWIGQAVNDSTLDLLDETLASISVP